MTFHGNFHPQPGEFCLFIVCYPCRLSLLCLFRLTSAHCSVFSLLMWTALRLMTFTWQDILWRIFCCCWKNPGEPVSDAVLGGCMTHLVLSVKKWQRSSPAAGRAAAGPPERRQRLLWALQVALHLHWRATNTPALSATCCKASSKIIKQDNSQLYAFIFRCDFNADVVILFLHACTCVFLNQCIW